MSWLADAFDRPTVAGWSSLKFFTFARCLIVGLILLAESVLVQRIGSAVSREQSIALLLVYFAFSCAFLWLAASVRASFYAQVLAQFFIDLLFIGLLLFQGGGLRSGLGILLLMPLSGAALLLPLGAALFCAAVTAMAFLLEAVYRSVTETGDVQWVASGLHGVGAFLIVGVFQVLTARVTQGERKAQLAAAAAEHAAQLSQRVMREMEPGVLVLDANLRVRSVNPAARALLADAGVFIRPGQPMPSGAQLADLLALIASFGNLAGGADAAPGEMQEIALGTAGERFGVRVAAVSRGADEPPDRVVFIENMRVQEERLQRAKLASMGRLTGSIAHEIRNPLAAISHAGALLADDVTEPGMQRMVAIIRDNAVRINLIIEDVLALSRSDRGQIQVIDLAQSVAEVVAELPGQPAIDVVGSASGLFDPLHLRLTLVNLLRNAQRHAHDQVLVRIEQPSITDVEIQVIDDGPVVARSARDHLFEPFFTTQTQGTGLGLYLAREYCVANRAQLSYEERVLSGTTIHPGESEKMFVIRLQAAK
jgi:two-component system, NtrC family, sensor histidine kinase PilS